MLIILITVKYKTTIIICQQESILVQHPFKNIWDRLLIVDVQHPAKIKIRKEATLIGLSLFQYMIT